MLFAALVSITVGVVAAKQPNIVLLFVDDWGWGDMGANWHAAAGMTPNLDKLAGEGIRFTDFHVGASVCSVSRAALLTGRLGVRNGVVTNFHVDSVAGLPQTELTIAELLKPAGYRTGILGKWHLGTQPGFHPSYRGFDQYLGIPYSVDMGCMDDRKARDHNHHLNTCGPHCKPTTKQYLLALPLYNSSTNCSGQSVGDCNGDILQAPVDLTTLSDKYRAFSTKFIGAVKHDPAPFFFYVPFSHIHTPQYVMPRGAGRSNKTGDTGLFYDTLLEVDETIGVIVDAIKANHVEDNTLVFVTGDNGPWEVKCNLTGSSGPYTGLWQKKHGGGGSSMKTTLWEGGHREVGLAWWPGKIAPRVSNATTSSLDYLPTILSLAGVTLPTDRVFDGMDLSDVLFNGSERGHETLFHPNSGASGIQGKLDGVRWKNFKAIYQTGGAPDCAGNKGNSTRHDPPLLFDLAVDPAEEFALDITQEPYKTALKTIKAKLAAQMKSVNTTFQSVVDTSQAAGAEPCADYAKKECRNWSPPTPPTPSSPTPSSPTPSSPTPAPPTPAGPPTPQPPNSCNASEWFHDYVPWEKHNPVPPFPKGLPASSAQECCDLCNNATNVKLGCRFWTWTKLCYMKVKVNKNKGHAAKGAVSGSIYPWVNASSSSHAI